MVVISPVSKARPGAPAEGQETLRTAGPETGDTTGLDAGATWLLANG
jgi:hypothetical protein